MAWLDPEDEEGVSQLHEGPAAGAPPLYSGPLPTGYSQAEVEDFIRRNPGHNPGTFDSSRVMSALNDRGPRGPEAPSSFSFATPGAPQSIQPFNQPFSFDPSQLGKSDGFKFRFDKAMQAIERSGAARGTLLNPQTTRALQEEASGLASQELDAEFGRQFATHGRAFDVHQFNEPMRFNSQRQNRVDDFTFADTNRRFDRGVLESDRGFDYGRERDRMGDLWRFVDYGYGAARR